MTRFAPSGPLRGSLAPPPDKSISHRAAILGAMGEGKTAVTRYLDAADTRSTLAGVREIGAGVAVTETAAGLDVEIDGVGLRGPRPAAIDVGNAGTLLRILPG
jgi:3-phosphoshikimate 1-carboxyvinyltransferase